MINLNQDEQIVNALEEVALASLAYVGSANYYERRNAATKAVVLAFRAAREGRVEDIKFTVTD